MPTKYLHFDTNFGNYIEDDNNKVISAPSPFECQFILPQKITNVRKVSLKSVEMPIMFGQIRQYLQTFTTITNHITHQPMIIAVQDDNAIYSAGLLKIGKNGTPYYFYLSSQIYTTIDSLISDLNTMCSTTLGGTFSTVAVSGSNKLNICLTLTSSATITFYDSFVSTIILGFRSATDSGTALSFTSSGHYNLQPDPYLSMYISNLPNGNNSVSGKPCTFKIPLSSNYNSVLFHQENTTFEQYVDVPKSFNYVLDKLNVIIYDRLGNNINNFFGDYSFTLAIEYDE